MNKVIIMSLLLTLNITGFAWARAVPMRWVRLLSAVRAMNLPMATVLHMRSWRVKRRYAQQLKEHQVGARPIVEMTGCGWITSTGRLADISAYANNGNGGAAGQNG
jgi:hypothetical protein